ncbi:protein roadkill [Caerostris darwini]|uniref:Protein roadkill n=1 Tax=Caerostris darwini TaxID=1538125 RepID=A0AAV4SE12_9ARAC|nr:protein roadkill [Caerostris darwini]
MGMNHSSTISENVTQTVKWKVENISRLTQNKVIIGPKLYFSRSCRGNFALEIMDDHLHIHFRNKSDTDLKINCTISYLKYRNEQFEYTPFEHLGYWDVQVPKNRCKTVTEIGNFTEFIKILPADTLTLQFELSTEGSVNTPPESLLWIPKAEDKTWFDERTKLLSDLSSMHLNENTDVNLKVGEHVVPAHWSILCARSPYFKKMYQTEMKERLQNSVVITDVPAKAVKEFVSFLYTGILEEQQYENSSLDEMYNLYYAADKYEVLDLRKMCAFSLSTRISVDTAIQILIWANMHNDEEVKAQVMDFIASNFSAIADTDTWKKLLDDNTKLAVEVIAFCTEKLKNSR